MANTETRRVNIYLNTDDAIKRMDKLQHASLKLHEEIQQLSPGTDAFVARTKKLEEAQKRLNAVEQEAKRVREQLESMTEGTAEYAKKAKEFDRVQAQVAKAGQEVKKLEINTDELLEKNEKLRSITQEYDNLADKVSGKVAPSMRDLKDNVRRLERELDKLPEGTDEFIKKTAELQKVKARLNEVKTKVNDTATSWQKFKKSFGDIGNIAAGTIIGEVALLGWQSLGNFIGGAVEGAEKLSDSIADIQKTTGMSKAEVEALNAELGKINTRTASADLREIARVGGQLGIAKEEMAGFVEMTDRAVVALGDDFGGGAEEVARQLGSLQKLFKETADLKADEAMSRIGSAINHLGSISSARAPEIAEFTKRMGTLGSLGPSISETMGLAAALTGDLGLNAEIASGGLTALFLTAGKESEAFAAQMGISKEAFVDLMNSDPNEMILRLAESFQGLDNDQVINALDRMKVGSQESIKVMSLLANQTGFVKKQQEEAAKAMQENTSLQDEFNIKNQNFAAEMAKARKEINGFVMAIGQGLVPIITDLIGAFITVLNFLRQMPKLYKENKDIILALGIAVATLNRHTIASNASILANRTAVIAQAAATKGAAIATNIMTGAQQLLNVAMRANPIGLIVTAVGLLVAALVVLYNRNETVRDSINGTWELMKTFGMTIAKGIIDSLKGIGTLLEGIFTLDWDKIKEGFKMGVNGALDAIPITSAIKNGEKLGAAFNKGFDKVRDENNAEFAAAATATEVREQGNKAMAGMGATGGASGDGLDKALAEKIAEENRKRAEELGGAKPAGTGTGVSAPGVPSEDEAKQQYEALLEQYRQFNEQLAEMDEERRLKAMTDDEAELERIRLGYDDKIAEVQSYQQKALESEKLSEEQKATLKKQFDEQMVRLEEEKLLAMEEKRGEFEERDRIKREELKAQIEEMQRSDIENELIESQAYFDALIAQAEQYGLDAQGLEEMKQQALQEIRDRYADDELKKEKAKQQEIFNAQMGALSEFSGLLSATNNLIGEGGEKMADFQHKLAMAQLAIDTGVAISKSIAAATAAAAAGGPAAPFIVGGYIASMLATVLSAFGRAKGMIDSANTPSAPSFFFGGFTGRSKGNMGGDQFGKFTGMVHEDEYVTPKKVMESDQTIPMDIIPPNPKAADLVGILEAMRMGKTFFEGGPTSRAAAERISEPGMNQMSGQNNQMSQMMNQMMGVLGRLELRLNEPLKSESYFVWDDFEEQTNDIETIKTESKA